ncbi:MAG: GNAT family N-acetyltransferase [Pseudomonadota bacterium]|nr:GNAT family N-acetyltransferase [Pseudomonadota bacterium]
MFDRLPYQLERVRLRRLRSADLNDFLAYRRDPEVARYQGWAPMADSEASGFLEDHGRHVSLTPGAWHQLAIAQHESDLLIGDVGVWLSPDGSQAEIGISIASSFQGNGLGCECLKGLIELLFSATRVAEIVAHSDARNAACLSMLARSGMGRIDTRQVEYKGEACTEHSFSIRRTDR